MPVSHTVPFDLLHRFSDDCADLCEAIQAAGRIVETDFHAVASSMDRVLAELERRRLKPPSADGGAGAVASPVVERLSKRQRDVLRLSAQGYTRHEMGERLGVSARTVGACRARLLRELGIRDRRGLVRFALEHGLLVQRAPGISFGGHRVP